MPILKKPTTVSTKNTIKSAAPVTAKRIVSKALSKKQTAAPAKPIKRAAATQPVQAVVKTVLTPKTATKPTTKVSVIKEIKVEKVKKPKLIRDSFTIPKAEYLVLETLKERAVKLSRAAKKSELLRAGIKALAAMSDAAFLSALAVVPTIKTGRPSTAS